MPHYYKSIAYTLQPGPVISTAMHKNPSSHGLDKRVGRPEYQICHIPTIGLVIIFISILKGKGWGHFEYITQFIYKNSPAPNFLRSLDSRMEWNIIGI